MSEIRRTGSEDQCGIEHDEPPFCLDCGAEAHQVYNGAWLCTDCYMEYVLPTILAEQMIDDREIPF